MAHRTTFAGLAAPDPGESTAVLDGDFIYRNPDLIAQFLRIGAVSHRHDGHVALVNPQAPVQLQAVGSAGFLAAGQDYFVTYTAFDQYGGETASAPVADVTMPGGINAPSFTPSGAVSHAAGIMPAGNYAYALTYTDGQGGETTLGPTTWIYVDPGFASSQVLFTGFAAQLQASGGTAVTWRLWRSYEGEDWHLVTEAQTNNFTDAGFDPPDNPARPPDTNTTVATGNSLLVTLPTASAEPALASASSIDVYLSTDGAMLSPCLYVSLPIACAGTTFLIENDTVSVGAPPPVSLSIPGAARVNPDTDILDWHWKRPVANQLALPSGGQGDVRMTLDTGHLWGVLGASGAAGPAGWSDLLAIAGDVDSFVASAGGGSALVTRALEFAGPGVTISDLGGGSALVSISGGTGSGATGPPGPAGPAGAGAGTGTMFVQASGGSVLAPVDLEFVASAGPTVSVSSLGGSAGSATVTIPWLGVDVGASATPGHWGSAARVIDFATGGTNSQFNERQDNTHVVGHLLVDSTPGVGANVFDMWTGAGTYGEGYKVRAHYAGLSPGNWNRVGVFMNYSLTRPDGFSFVAASDGGFMFVSQGLPDNDSQLGLQFPGSSSNPGQFASGASDLWLEIWRFGTTGYGAIYTSDPALGASPIATVTRDLSLDINFDPTQVGYFGWGEVSWSTSSVGLADIRIVPYVDLAKQVLPFRREIDFAGSGGVGVGITDSGGGSAQVLITAPPGGLITLASGSATVNDATVTSTLRILLTAQDNNSTGALRVSARTPNASFTITSSNAGDNGVVAYQYFGT